MWTSPVLVFPGIRGLHWIAVLRTSPFKKPSYVCSRKDLVAKIRKFTLLAGRLRVGRRITSHQPGAGHSGMQDRKDSSRFEVGFRMSIQTITNNSAMRTGQFTATVPPWLLSKNTLHGVSAHTRFVIGLLLSESREANQRSALKRNRDETKVQ